MPGTARHPALPASSRTSRPRLCFPTTPCLLRQSQSPCPCTLIPPAPPRSLPLPCPSVLVLCPAPSPLPACLLLSGRSMSASLPLSVTFSTPAAPTPLTDGRGGRVRTHVSHAGCSLRDFSGSPCSSSLRRARNPSGRPAGRGSWAQALVISPKQPTRRAHMRPGLNYLGLLTLTLPPSQGSCAPGLGSS